jgi:alpha/beta superfamily hydrolase
MQATFRPPVPQPVEIEGPAGLLEARVEDPAGAVTPLAVGVVCHPHPLHGGTMQNKVVHTLARAMQEFGVPTVRFNFRGVGRSEGSYADGVGEAQDALAAVDFARRRWRCETLWLAGFSFGAAVAFEVSAAARPAKLVTVAPPVSRMELAARERPDCPWLIVQGDADELVEVAVVRRWAEHFEPPPRLEVFAGAEHFFHGRLAELRGVVGGFLAEPASG